MIEHGLESNLIGQVYRQVFYSITVQTLNNQLVRKELCNWTKAMQIRLIKKALTNITIFQFKLFPFRYNVSQLEDWIRNCSVDEASVRETLEPLVHASQLLQVKKSSSTDAEELCKMCTSLNSQQVSRPVNQ